MAGRPGTKMPVEQRAKQFMPFAALKELPEALAAKETAFVKKVELSEEMAAELDRKLHLLEKGRIVTVIYYSNGKYVKKTGMVARLDKTARILQIVNTKIAFQDIREISFSD